MKHLKNKIDYGQLKYPIIVHIIVSIITILRTKLASTNNFLGRTGTAGTGKALRTLLCSLLNMTPRVKSQTAYNFY